MTVIDDCWNEEDGSKKKRSEEAEAKAKADAEAAETRARAIARDEAKKLIDEEFEPAVKK